MKVLHLYHDWKWTGPSEPILNLCSGLKKQGLEIHLACLSAPQSTSQPINTLLRDREQSSGGRCGANLSSNQLAQRSLPDKAMEAGIPLLTLTAPPKYLSLFYIKPHINALAKYIEANRNFDIIHCHSALDHYYASRLRRRLRHSCVPMPSDTGRPDSHRGESRNPGSFKIIRTNHKGYPLESSIANKFLMKNAIDGYITLSENLAEADWKNFGLATERISAIPSGIDIKMFSTHLDNPPHLSPLPWGERLGEGKGFNLNPNDIVIGIVARVQRHRRFHIILEAMQSVIKEMPNVKLVIVGRGTYYNQLVTEPVKRLGLENNVIQAGYRTEDYLDILNTFDFGLFLVPGSDGSCRAALEIMASGKPLIVANRGILPEIVDNDKNGLVVDDTADNLAQAILKLAKDKALRERFGQSARAKVERDFTLERTVKLTQEFYQAIIK